MKTFLFSITFGLLSVASASQKLSVACEQNITNAVYDQFGRYDETFSVVGYKVIYENWSSGLVVVRTSDEVEPRDVLVSYDQAQSVCNAKYKEVLADGATSEMEDMIELSQAPQKVASNYSEVSGKVLSLTVGELDPSVIGDACLVQVQTEKEIVGLLTSQYDCEDNASKLKEGSLVTASLHKRDRIQDKAMLNVLKSLTKSSKFFNIPYSEIKAK